MGERELGKSMKGEEPLEPWQEKKGSRRHRKGHDGWPGKGKKNLANAIVNRRSAGVFHSWERLPSEGKGRDITTDC